MSKVVGAFRLLDFFVLQPILTWRMFLELMNRLFIYLIFQIFLGHGKLQICGSVR